MIKKIDHIGIAVKSIEETLAFYKTLGLSLAHTEAESEQRVVVAFLPAGKSEVELLEPIDEEGPVARFLVKRGEGMHHICFEVQDIEAILARLEEKGVELIDREPRIGTGGKKIAFIHPKDTHGVLIELYQKLPDEKVPPLVDLDALRERLRLQSEATRERLRLQSEAARERLRLQSEAARAGIEGFLSALQKKGEDQDEE
jgi:methylmalonyl-CoA epimerase